jgi:hypothetical protein
MKMHTCSHTHTHNLSSPSPSLSLIYIYLIPPKPSFSSFLRNVLFFVRPSTPIEFLGTALVQCLNDFSWEKNDVNYIVVIAETPRNDIESAREWTG